MHDNETFENLAEKDLPGMFSPAPTRAMMARVRELYLRLHQLDPSTRVRTSFEERGEGVVVFSIEVASADSDEEKAIGQTPARAVHRLIRELRASIEKRMENDAFVLEGAMTNVAPAPGSAA